MHIPPYYINAFETAGRPIDSLPEITEDQARAGSFDGCVGKIVGVSNTSLAFKVVEKKNGALAQKVVIKLFKRDDSVAPPEGWPPEGWKTCELSSSPTYLSGAIIQATQILGFYFPFIGPSGAMTDDCIVKLYDGSYSYSLFGQNFSVTLDSNSW